MRSEAQAWPHNLHSGPRRSLRTSPPRIPTTDVFHVAGFTHFLELFVIAQWSKMKTFSREINTFCLASRSLGRVAWAKYTYRAWRTRTFWTKSSLPSSGQRSRMHNLVIHIDLLPLWKHCFTVIHANCRLIFLDSWFHRTWHFRTTCYQFDASTNSTISYDIQMKLCVLTLLWITLCDCIVIDNDYNVAMDDEVTPQTSAAKRKDRRNCTRDTAIIDKLLNGTGYNKFRIPSKGFDRCFFVVYRLFVAILLETR